MRSCSHIYTNISASIHLRVVYLYTRIHMYTSLLHSRFHTLKNAREPHIEMFSIFNPRGRAREPHLTVLFEQAPVSMSRVTWPVLRQRRTITDRRRSPSTWATTPTTTTPTTTATRLAALYKQQHQPDHRLDLWTSCACVRWAATLAAVATPIAVTVGWPHSAHSVLCFRHICVSISVFFGNVDVSIWHFYWLPTTPLSRQAHLTYSIAVFFRCQFMMCKFHVWFSRNIEYQPPHSLSAGTSHILNISVFRVSIYDVQIAYVYSAEFVECIAHKISMCWGGKKKCFRMWVWK